jgi:hypothetical protein
MTNGETKHTNIRSTSGRYAKECAFCECPDGCGCFCTGEACPCGSVKEGKQYARAQRKAIVEALQADPKAVKLRSTEELHAQLVGK